MQRRDFLFRVGGAVLGAAAAGWVLGPRDAFAKKKAPKTPKVDEPRPGKGKGDKPVEVNGGPVVLPPWPHGGNSTAPDAMLMFRGNPSHAGFYGTGKLPDDKAPKIRWQHKMEEFPSLYYGEPFVWKGTGWTGQPIVYAGYVWIGGQGRSFYCFEAATGKVRWRFEGTRQFKGSSCFWDNKIYQGSVDDYLRCIDASTGEVLWKINTGKDLDSSPCVVDGRLYIAGENGHARCVDALTGKQCWKTFVGGINRGPKHGSYGSETSPAVVDGAYYCAQYDGEVWCIDAATGEKRWVAQTGDDTDASPVVAGGVVLAAAQDKSPYLFAFSTADGKELWKHKGRGGYWGTPAVMGDTVVIGSAGGKLDALELRSGKVKWSSELKGGTWSSPAIVDGKVLIGGIANDLVCYGLGDGKELWRVKLGGHVHSTPVVIDGHIYVGSTGGSFFAIG